MALAFYKEPGKKPRYWSGKETHSHYIPIDFEGFTISDFEGTDIVLIDSMYSCEEVVFAETFSSLNFTNASTAVSKNEFISYVELCKNKIEQGKCNKIVAARYESMALPQGFSFNQFVSLVTQEMPSAYISVYQGEKGTFISASPELLLSLVNENAETVALAGTALWDKREELGLKEKEEQDFINLHSKAILEQMDKSVKTSPKQVIKAGNLAHYCNTLTFTSHRSELNALLSSLHPTPAVGGYPMQSALSFIIQNEPIKRGFYAGFSGIVSKNYSVLSVNLRCAYFENKSAYLFAGAGITNESKAEKEWVETENKIKVMANLIRHQIRN